MGDKTDIMNGQIYEAPWPLCHTVIVQYFGYVGEDNKWILLSNPDGAAGHKGNCMIVCCYERKDKNDDNKYDPFYTQEELKNKLKNWTLLNKKLVLGDIE